MKIKQIDRQIIPLIRSEIDQALKALAEKFDVTISAGNASFTPESVTFKLAVTTKGEGGKVETKEGKDFKLYAEMYGLKKEDLGKEIKVGINTYIITGLALKSRKYPVTVTDTRSGTGYKLQMSAVKRALGYPVTAFDLQ